MLDLCVTMELFAMMELCYKRCDDRLVCYE